MGRRLQSLASALTGAVAAAGMMYYFDAGSGPRRRADRGQSSAGAARGGLSRLQAASRDLAHRAYGLGARATALLHRGPIDPAVLVERVRSRLGRVVSHPGAIHVAADEEHTVRLTGVVLAWEHEPLRRAVADVPGIAAVRDELEICESAQPVGALQGLPQRARSVGATESGTTAALRVLMALAGGSLLLSGSRRRGTVGAVGAAAGSALLLRSVAAPRRRVPRQRGRALEICQTLHLHAPIESVYEALRRSDRLVCVLPCLRALRHRSDGATQWSVHDPQGWPLQWTALITEIQPNRQIAWRTTDDSMLTQWGMAWLESIDAQQTRLHLYVSLRALPGRTGMALRRLLGTGPHGELTENLSRLRQYLELGAAAGAHGSGRVTGSTGDAGSGKALGKAPGVSATKPDLLGAWTQPLDGRTH